MAPHNPFMATEATANSRINPEVERGGRKWSLPGLLLVKPPHKTSRNFFVQKHLTIGFTCYKFLKNLFHVAIILKKLFLIRKEMSWLRKGFQQQKGVKRSRGAFLANHHGFLDTEYYRPGRRLVQRSLAEQILS